MKPLDPQADAEALESILWRYAHLVRMKPFLRLRAIELERDKDGGVLIQLSDLIDALWDAAEDKSRLRADPYRRRAELFVRRGSQ